LGKKKTPSFKHMVGRGEVIHTHSESHVVNKGCAPKMGQFRVRFVRQRTDNRVSQRTGNIKKRTIADIITRSFADTIACSGRIGFVHCPIFCGHDCPSFCGHPLLLVRKFIFAALDVGQRAHDPKAIA